MTQTPIRDEVERADRLISKDEPYSALIHLLIAVAASSKKMFRGRPEATKSDRWQFERFLGQRIRTMFGFVDLREDGRHDALPQFAPGDTPESVLYKEYRCVALHEARLPDDRAFEFTNGLQQHDTFGLQFGHHSVKFSQGLLTLLRAAVAEAPTNGKEFGKTHLRLFPKGADDRGDAMVALLGPIAAAYGSTPGRIHALVPWLEETGPAALTMGDDEIRLRFQRYFESGQAKTAALTTGRYDAEDPFNPRVLCSRDGRLTDQGLSALRDLMRGTEIVDIAS